jgi:hypothetical protein
MNKISFQIVSMSGVDSIEISKENESQEKNEEYFPRKLSSQTTISGIVFYISQSQE